MKHYIKFSQICPQTKAIERSNRVGYETVWDYDKTSEVILDVDTIVYIENYDFYDHKNIYKKVFFEAGGKIYSYIIDNDTYTNLSMYLNAKDLINKLNTNDK